MQFMLHKELGLVVESGALNCLEKGDTAMFRYFIAKLISCFQPLLKGVRSSAPKRKGISRLYLLSPTVLPGRQNFKLLNSQFEFGTVAFSWGQEESEQ